MSGRDKDVMIYHYEPKKKIYLVSLYLENKPGALGNLADILAVRGINILEGFFGGMSYGERANLSFFCETTNSRMDAEWLKDYLETSVFASDVEVRSATDGMLVDSVNFPLTWNTGERAVLMRVGGLHAMFDSVVKGHPKEGAEELYHLGFEYGKEAWTKLVGVYKPKSKESLNEALKIYSATGWGRPELQEFDPGRMRARLKVSECFECSAQGEGARGSNFVRGHLAGALSAYFGQDVDCAETKCVKDGSPTCEFEITS